MSGTILASHRATSGYFPEWNFELGKNEHRPGVQQLHREPCIYASVDAFIFMFADHVRTDDAVRPHVLPPLLSAFHRSLPTLAGCGFPVIVDHVLEKRSWAIECADALRDRRAFFVGVHCPVEILEERERARGDRQVGFARWQFPRGHAHGAYDFEIDTSRCTAAQAAQQLIDLVCSDHEPVAFAQLRAGPTAHREERAKVRMRPCAERETDDWMRLRGLLWPDCLAERHHLEMAQFRASPGVVAVAENLSGELVGFAEVSLRHEHVEGTAGAPVPYLEGWFVEEAWRGRGVGRALIAFVEQWALTQGFRELASDAELDNAPSIAAHDALGFTGVGRSVHFVKRLKR